MKMLTKNILSHITTMLFPYRCISCSEIVHEKTGLCSSCWPKIEFLSEPWCKVCGTPTDGVLLEDGQCYACFNHPPSYEQYRSAMYYDDASKDFILRFKHADQTYLSGLFAEWMVHAGSDICRRATVIIPVPLFWTRLFKRQYNQAGLLANKISQRTKIKVCQDALIRTKPSGDAHAGYQERFQNIKGAFKINPKRLNLIQNQNIVIIDDVCASGSTIKECVKILKPIASSVSVLTLARVHKHD